MSVGACDRYPSTEGMILVSSLSVMGGIFPLHEAMTGWLVEAFVHRSP